MIFRCDPVNTAGHFLARAHYIYAALQVLGVAENSLTKLVKHQVLECILVSLRSEDRVDICVQN